MLTRGAGGAAADTAVARRLVCVTNGRGLLAWGSSPHRRLKRMMLWAGAQTRMRGLASSVTCAGWCLLAAVQTTIPTHAPNKKQASCLALQVCDPIEQEYVGQQTDAQ